MNKVKSATQSVFSLKSTDIDRFYSDDTHTHIKVHYLYWILISVEHLLNPNILTCDSKKVRKLVSKLEILSISDNSAPLD